MIAVVLLAVVLFETVICDVEPILISASDNRASDNRAPRHGGGGGTELNFVCPYNGAVTGINYRSGLRVDQMSFVCSSWAGRTTFGPYGSGNGSPGTVSCPVRHYISSIYGRSNDRVDRIGIRCRHDTDMTSHGQDMDAFGGTGGNLFDDLNYSIGARIVSISVRSGSELDAIQFTYGDNYLPPLCTDCNQYVEEWGPKHGGNGGEIHAFVCPNEGVIIGISFTIGQYLNTIRFTCVSRTGQTTFGPYGGDVNNIQGHDICDPGMYISSILGRSGQDIDKIAIRCVKPGHTGKSPGRHGHGSDTGNPFDDEDYTLQGHRPVEIRVWAGVQVDAIQIKYANLPVYFLEGHGPNEMIFLPGYDSPEDNNVINYKINNKCKNDVV